MVFPVVGGTQDTGYEIENSCQFNTDAYCEFTPSSGSGSTQFTYSAWIKNCGAGALSETGMILSGAGAGSGADNGIQISAGGSAGKIQFIEYDGGDNAYYIRTNRLFRDPAAWFHLVLIYDAPDSTAGDRMRLYINGTRETSFSHEVQLPQDRAHAGFTRSSVAIRVGSQASGSNQRFDGYLADVYFCDGQNYEPSEFGETDDNGVWIPKEADVSFGTNGFKLEFKQTGTSANASGIGADTSGNDNHFSVSGLAAENITTDTPTNNFATWNSLHKASNVTLSEGNCKAAIAGAGQSRSTTSTIAVSKGKWYFEIKYTADVVSGFIGLVSADIGWNINATEYPSSGVSDNVGFNDGGTKYVNGTSSSYGSGFGNNDIIGVAANLDDDEVVFYVNGTAQNSGTAISKTFSGDYFFVVQHQSGSGTSNFEVNFGNPTFSISSGNADANGYGNFEYAPPSGFYAVCTKNLAQYG